MYVHGHPRGDTWVVAHLRAPTAPEVEQLPLFPPPAEPPAKGADPRPVDDHCP